LKNHCIPADLDFGQKIDFTFRRRKAIVHEAALASTYSINGLLQYLFQSHYQRRPFQSSVGTPDFSSLAPKAVE